MRASYRSLGGGGRRGTDMQADVIRKCRRLLLTLAICVLTVCGMLGAAVTSPHVAYAAPQGPNDAPVTFSDASDQCVPYSVPTNAQVLEVLAVGGAGKDGSGAGSGGGSGGSGGHGGQVTAYIEVPPSISQQTRVGVQVGSTGFSANPPLGYGGSNGNGG